MSDQDNKSFRLELESARMQRQFTAVCHQYDIETNYDEKTLIQLEARDGGQAGELVDLVLFHQADHTPYILVRGWPLPLHGDVKIRGPHLFVEWVRELLDRCEGYITRKDFGNDWVQTWRANRAKLQAYLAWLEETK